MGNKRSQILSFDEEVHTFLRSKKPKMSEYVNALVKADMQKGKPVEVVANASDNPSGTQ